MTAKTLEEVIKEACMIHKNYYSYDNAVYNGNKGEFIVTCPIHGDFTTTPHSHINGKHGCPLCGRTRQRTKTSIEYNEYIRRCKNKFGDRFIYKDDSYTNLNGNVSFECQYHGFITMRAKNHLNSVYGCPICSKESKKADFKVRILPRFIEIHNNQYVYDEKSYYRYKEKMRIFCLKCNSWFLQSPEHHIKGRGCPNCCSSKGENQIYQWLDNNNIKYVKHKKFNWLGKQHIDCYLTDYNIGIEYQGKQHFTVVDFSGHDYERAVNDFIKTQQRDKRKKQLCFENNVSLHYITYNDNIKEKLNNLIKII